MPKILFVAAEAHPFAKTGGLGDVVGALPHALVAHGADVRTLIPAYGAVLKEIQKVHEVARLGSILDGVSARLLEVTEPALGSPFWLLDCPSLFQRAGGPYGDASGADWNDNHLRFGALCRAAAMIGTAGDTFGWRPDIIHLHDWHAGLVPYYLQRWGGPVPPTVFTIHNLAHKGLFGTEVLDALCLDRRDFTPGGFEFWGKLSFLKAALVGADTITTVSPTYAREITTSEFGEGLEGVIQSRAPIHGLLNGIDEACWSPECDRFIPSQYGPKSLDLKDANKHALQAALGLAQATATPLVAVVARLTEQKGIDLLIEAIPLFSETNAQLVVLGEGDPKLADELRRELCGYPARMCFRQGFDESLAHQIIAGADMLLMPSRFEPCGMTQLYAQRYGTLPIVHRVGGLADTVHHGRDGFAFNKLTVDAMLGAMRAAFTVYANAERWRRMQHAAMAKPVSWQASAARYMELYRELLPRAGRAPA